MNSPAVKSIFGRIIFAPGQKAIINLCLSLASPVAANDNTTTGQESVIASGYRISLGLVEISALATLIGATNAEALALGLAAAPGLPWAPISTFGAVHVIKVSLAAVMSDRIRGALGLRGTAVDSAVGMSLEIDSTKPELHNADSGAPCGILLPHTNRETGRDLIVDSKELGRSPHTSPESEKHHQPRAVFAFGRNIASAISNLPSTSPGEELEIYRFSQDRGPDGAHNTKNDRIALVASLLKLMEVYALWRAGATTIWWVTGLAWAHGLLAALVLLSFDLSRDSSKLGQVDIVTGELPTPLLPGGPRKIVLGLPYNVRRHYLWKVVWGTGTFVNCLSILCIFVFLGSQSTDIVYIWVGFQIFWLVIRTVIYNFLAVGNVRRNIMISQSWEMATLSARRRLVALMMGLAKQQITIHPRGAFVYQEDLTDGTAIMKLYQTAGYRCFEALPLTKIPKEQRADIAIIGIVGDTALRSFAWFQGAVVLSPDLYDCVLVFVEIAGCVFAVPGVRVLSGLPLGDVEDRISNFEPRGTSNNGFQVSWKYWIPATDTTLGQCWLEAQGMKIKGEKMGVLTQGELQMKLQGGGLNISLVQVGEVERILEQSRKASEVLIKLLVDAELC